MTRPATWTTARRAVTGDALVTYRATKSQPSFGATSNACTHGQIPFVTNGLTHTGAPKKTAKSTRTTPLSSIDNSNGLPNVSAPHPTVHRALASGGGKRPPPPRWKFTHTVIQRQRYHAHPPTWPAFPPRLLQRVRPRRRRPAPPPPQIDDLRGRSTRSSSLTTRKPSAAWPHASEIPSTVLPRRRRTARHVIVT